MQKGQAMVEFAFIVPFLVFLFLALIYGGILFMDYIQYNNAARAIARDVAFENSDTIDTNALKLRYFNPLTTLYTATLDPPEQIKDAETHELKEVKVTIKFKRAVNLGLFNEIGFPPNELKDIVYIMPVETVAKQGNEGE